MESCDQALWARLRSHGDTRARELLYARHAPWASAIAKRVHRRFTGYSVDRDDFIQNANIGLLDAIDRFDPTRGIEFRAYAAMRVRGSVFNGIRAIIGAPGRERFDERLEHLGAAGDDAFDNVVESIVGLGLGYMLDDLAHSPLADSSDGLAFVQRHQVAWRLAAAVETLPPRLKSLIVRHYFEFEPLVRLAEEWRVTKGRVSQIHRAALDALRKALGEL